MEAEGEMVELNRSGAVWRKSNRSHEGTTADCVEVATLWRKSTRSGGGEGTCVEAAAVADRVVAMRDSKDPDGAVLCFTHSEWAAFLGRIKTGALD